MKMAATAVKTKRKTRRVMYETRSCGSVIRGSCECTWMHACICHQRLLRVYVDACVHMSSEAPASALCEDEGEDEGEGEGEGEGER